MKSEPLLAFKRIKLTSKLFKCVFLKIIDEFINKIFMNQLGKKKSDYNKIILGGSKSMYFVRFIYSFYSLSLSLLSSLSQKKKKFFDVG